MRLTAYGRAAQVYLREKAKAKPCEVFTCPHLAKVVIGSRKVCNVHAEAWTRLKGKRK